MLIDYEEFKLIYDDWTWYGSHIQSNMYNQLIEHLRLDSPEDMTLDATMLIKGPSAPGANCSSEEY